MGMGLFVVNSLANHDCNPNAIILYDGPRAVMRALRRIEAGTEVGLANLISSNATSLLGDVLSNQVYFTLDVGKRVVTKFETSQQSADNATVSGRGNLWSVL